METDTRGIWILELSDIDLRITTFTVCKEIKDKVSDFPENQKIWD